jgi:hypothetical protein
MVTSVKETVVKTLIAAGSALVGIVGTVATIDARYAHAADVTNYQQSVATEIKAQGIRMQKQTLEIRKQLLEDRVFELDFKREQSQSQGSKLSPHHYKL